MPTTPSIVASICRPVLALSLLASLAGCLEEPDDGELDLAEDTEAAERQSAPAGRDPERDPELEAPTAALAKRTVIASNGTKSITCSITAQDPYKFGTVKVVYGVSKVTCDKYVSNISLTSYLNKGGFRWKSSNISRQDIALTVNTSGVCSGTSLYRTEAAYTITFPSGYSVVSGSRSGSFKSDNAPTISC